MDNTEVHHYFALHTDMFNDFESYLNDELLGNLDSINISRQETRISDNMFKRLENIVLIDKYKAYQAFSDEWVKTAIDLEIIQTEGFSAVKVVDPNMVTKKKGDIEYEVQDGWAGRILPFELVQSVLFKAEADALRLKISRITEIAATLEETFESLTEEDKEDYREAFNDDDKYIKSVVVSIARKLRASDYNKSSDYNKGSDYNEDSIEAKFILANTLFIEETTLKREIKEDEAALHQLTKETIEGLSDDAALSFLKMKWIDPIIAVINELPHEVIRELVTKLTVLTDKYAVTYVEVTGKINKAKNEVAALIDQLRGNEYDMKGLGELQALLRGGKDGK
jgi:type I restriction enzyme M protein